MRTLRRSNRLLTIGFALLAIAAERAVSYWLGIDRLVPGIENGLLAAWGIGHCDKLDGPVVTLAREALETGNADHVLPWVRPGDEQEIRHALDHAVSVRKLGPRARELADTHFFETVVRVHRASEGAPYTGLKPAGADLDPAVAAADKALESGLVKELVILLTDAVRSGAHRHFQAAIERRNFPVNDVAAGRAYVAAYESYVHYIERLWEAATQAEAHGHPAGMREGRRAAQAH